MSRIVLLFALFVSGSPLWAVGPQITGVSGASNVRLTGAIRIFGAIPGSNRTDSCQGNGTEPCSTCTAANLTACGAKAPLCVCSTKLVYNNLDLTISAKTTGTKPLALAWSNNGNYTNLTAESTSPTSLTLKWSELCKRYVDGGCTGTIINSNVTNGVLNLALFNDTNGDGIPSTGEEKTDFTVQFLAPSKDHAIASDYGINSFAPFPGDEKIYITEPSSTNFPNLEHGGTAVSTRVFLSTTSMDTASPLSNLEPKDLSVSSTAGEFTSNIVDGVNNGTWYYVRLAQMDEAGNIVDYFPDLNVPGCGTPQTCPYAVKPDEVLGLLSKDMNCFVATAAYGSAWEPKLKVFRDFRYKVLLRHPWGIGFVKAYYTYGPYAARYIADKPWLRAITRLSLWPAYAFSYLALKLGFASAFGALFLSICGFLFAINRVISRRTLKRG